MANQRYRILLSASAALAGVWLLAYLGYTLALRSKVTPETLRAYVAATDLNKLSAADRAKAIQKLADQLNHLTWDDRQQARVEGLWRDWFSAMTDAEKAQFVEATLPTGMKQMLNAFEALPGDQRQRAINDSLRNLQRDLARAREASGRPADANPPISNELRQRIVSLGLTTFYNQSSAQTKAEVAPLLEELQRVMESGRLFHRGHPPGP